MTTASGGSDVADFCVNEEGFVKMAKETLSSDVDNFVKRQYIVEMAEAGLWSLASNIFFPLEVNKWIMTEGGPATLPLQF